MVCHRRILPILLLLCVTWPDTSRGGEVDICNMYNKPMFCNCAYASRDEYSITCFVFRSLSKVDELWDAFGNIPENNNTAALTFASRLPTQLEFLPTSALRHLPHLQTFIIQEGKLDSIGPYSVSNMTHLTRLLLERNEITNLEPNAIAHLPNLKKLILSENHLREILANTLVDLMALEELFLDRNNISRIETCAFCSLHNLRELELWDNQLTDLTEFMFRGLRYLTRLDLYKNHIRLINAHVFRSMPRLTELDLKENLIEHLSPRAFDGLTSLLRLHLNDNRLKTLPDLVFQFPKTLMHVDISSNELSTLTAAAVENLANWEDSYFSLRFKDNPLHCGCDLKWVGVFAEKVKSTVFLRELRHAKCRTKYRDWEKIANLYIGSECDTKTTVLPLTTQHVRRKSTSFKNDTQMSSSITYEAFDPSSGDNITIFKSPNENIDMEVQEAFDKEDDTSSGVNIRSCFTLSATVVICLLWKCIMIHEY